MENFSISFASNGFQLTEEFEPSNPVSYILCTLP